MVFFQFRYCESCGSQGELKDMELLLKIIFLVTLLSSGGELPPGTEKSFLKIEKTQHREFPAIRMSSPYIELEVVPEINRIMGLRALPDGENILWESRSTRYFPWINYGGSKVWPAPQSSWRYAWPPRRDIEQKGGVCEIGKDGSLLLKTPFAASSGVRFERRIELFADRPGLRLTETIINESPVSKKLSAWEVSQLKPKGMIILPLLQNVEMKMDYGIIPPHTKISSVLFMKDDMYKRKLSLCSREGVSAYFYKGTLLLRRELNVPLDGRYSDGDGNVEIFCGNGYIEMEGLGELRELAPGERRSFIHEWYLFRIDRKNDWNSVSEGFL